MLIQADARSKKKGLLVQCPVCRRDFQTWACRLKLGQGTFCSHSCSQKARVGPRSSRWTGGKIPRICRVCGAGFSVDPVQVRRGKAKYCSLACQHTTIDMKGAKNPRFKHGQSNTIEFRRLSRHRRRALVRGAAGSYSQADVDRLFAAQDGKCHYCRKALETWHVDHMDPLSRGGSNSVENLQLLCPTCNLRKARRNHLEYAREIGRLF